MPPKGGKKAPLTEEEKLALQKQKAEAEAELARQKEAARIQRLKDKLRNEERNCEFNLLRVTQNWREVMRQSRAEELRCHIEILSQNTKRVIEHKDRIIKSLMSVLSNATRQTEIAQKAHLEHLNCLLKLHDDLLEALELQWKNIIYELICQFDTEREWIKKLNHEQNERMDDTSVAVGLYSTEIRSEAEKNFQSASEKIALQATEASHNLVIQLGSTVEKLSKHYTAVAHHDSTVKKGEIQNEEAETLHARDMRDAQKIDMQMSRLQKMQDTIDSLRSHLISSQRESETCIYGLRAARDDLTLRSGELKAKLCLTQAGNKGHLTEFSVESNNTINKIQHFLKKGEKILRKAEINSKFETEQERLYPFTASSVSSEDLSHEVEPPSEELAQAIVDHEVLETFWQHYNKAQLESECQQQDNAVLQQENERLMAVLKKHMDGTNVSHQQNPPAQLKMGKHHRSARSKSQTVESRHTKCLEQESKNRLLWKRKTMAKPKLATIIPGTVRVSLLRGSAKNLLSVCGITSIKNPLKEKSLTC